MTAMTISNSAAEANLKLDAGPTTASVDIFSALLEALTRPDHYRLIQRGGELYIEPVAPGSVC